MDTTPFLEIDLLDIKESLIPELKKFTKAAFDETTIFNTASELKYSYEIKKYFEQQLKEPSDDFTVHIIKSFSDMRMTQPVIEKFRPIVKKTINNYISELMNDKISNALKVEKTASEVEQPKPVEEAIDEASNIVTTEDENSSLYIVKSILAETVSPRRVIGKDTVNYYSIILDGKSSKWICKLRYSEKKKTFCFAQDGKEDRIIINYIEDIYQFKQRLIDTVKLLDDKRSE
ncbi:MAG: hypothetical protein WCG21_06510 [Eubacteriales bacterium]